MQVTDEMAVLRRAANRVMLRYRLRWLGTMAIVFGLAAIVGGALTLGSGVSGIVLLAVGALSVLVGTWAFSAASAVALCVTGGAVAIVGLWSIVAAALTHGSPIWYAIGVVEILCSGLIFKEYGAFQGRDMGKPDARSISLVERLVKSIKESSGGSRDIIEYDADGKKWRGKLLPNGAVLVRGSGSEIIAADKDFVNIIRSDPSQIGPMMDVSVQAGAVTVAATMHRDQLDHYTEWKAPAPAKPTRRV